MPFESLQPQPAKEKKMKLAPFETRPDVEEELVRLAKAQRDRFKGAYSLEAAFGIAFTLLHDGEPETPGLLREKDAYRSQVIKRLKEGEPLSQRRTAPRPRSNSRPFGSRANEYRLRNEQREDERE